MHCLRVFWPWWVTISLYFGIVILTLIANEAFFAQYLGLEYQTKSHSKKFIMEKGRISPSEKKLSQRPEKNWPERAEIEWKLEMEMEMNKKK